MRGRKSPLVVLLTAEERCALECWTRKLTIRASMARRARVILLFAEGKQIAEIARLLHITPKTVRCWIVRFVQKRLPGLEDKKGRGRKPTFSRSNNHLWGKTGLRDA